MKNVDVTEPYKILTTKMEGWIEAAISVLPNFVVALLVVAIAAMVGRIVRFYTRKWFEKIAPNPFVATLSSNTVFILILGIGISISLGVLNLERTVTSLLAGAGVVGLALGIAFQDIAGNFFSGLLISFRKPFQEGDVIEAAGVLGKVQEVNLRNTVIKTFDGVQVLVPNSKVIEAPMTNLTRYGSRRINLAVGVSYAEDLEAVSDICIKALSALDGVRSDPPPRVDYEEFGGSSINFQARFWIDYPGENVLIAKSDALKAIKAAFNENGITIPFPIRTIDLGIKGGVSVRETFEQLSPEKGNLVRDEEN